MLINSVCLYQICKDVFFKKIMTASTYILNRAWLCARQKYKMSYFYFKKMYISFKYHIASDVSENSYLNTTVSSIAPKH